MLLELGKGFDAAGYAIKQFPEKLKKELEESNVEYDNEPFSFRPGRANNDLSKSTDLYEGKDLDKSEHGWSDKEWFKNKGVKLYQQKVNYHAFHTPYYSISIGLEIFRTEKDYFF